MSDTEHLKVQILLGPKAEDNKNQDWLRGMLDALIAEAQREALEKAVKVAESETELPGKMPSELWAKLRKQNMETILRQNVSATKKSIARKLRALLPSEVKP